MNYLQWYKFLDYILCTNISQTFDQFDHPKVKPIIGRKMLGNQINLWIFFSKYHVSTCNWLIK